jgi:hypothetical protein
MIHVPYETFWTLNLKTMKPFLKAYDNEVDAAHNRLNLEAWVIGIYVQHAVAANFGKSNKYPNKPLEIFSKQKTAEEEAREFAKFVEQHNKQRRERARLMGQTH